MNDLKPLAVSLLLLGGVSGCATLNSSPQTGGAYSLAKRSGLAESVVNRWLAADIQKPKEVFNPEDPQVTWWAEFPPFTFISEPKFLARWYSPDGSVFKEENFSTLWGNLQWAAVSLPIHDGLARTLQGQWRVEVLHNGRALDRKDFFVGTPQVKKFAQLTRSGKEGQLTLTFLPCYDDLTGGATKLLAVSIDQISDPKNHIETLKKDLRGNPDDAVIWVKVGWTQTVTGEPKAAEESFLKADQLRPQSAFIQNLLGMSRSHLKKYKEAEESFLSALQLQPKSPQIHFNLGETRLVLGKYAEAKLAYEQALALGLEDPRTAKERIALMDRALQRKYQVASQDVQSLGQPAVSLDSAEGLLYLGAIRYAGRRYEEAISLLRQALEKDSKLCDARLLLGMIYLDREFPEQAEKEFALAIQLDSSRLEAYAGAAATYIRLKQYDKAEQALEKASSLKRDDPKIHELFGDLYLAQERFQEAVPSYENSIRLKSAGSGAHLGLASALRGNKDFKRAAQEYEETLRLDPNSVDAHIGLGACHHALGDDERAAEHLLRALRLDPQRQDALLLYQELEQQGRRGNPPENQETHYAT